MNLLRIVTVHRGRIGYRVFVLSGISVLLACVATVAAQFLNILIALITNLAFFHEIGVATSEPNQAPNWGLWVMFIPAIGGIIIGLIARFGSRSVRGHGIPEAMEQVLVNDSRIPYRMIFLKPLASAISIGTGGPFGAEGPIIATGGALGSSLGQVLRLSSPERKILLAAGAAAGMSAIFGSPIASVLLAVELLLFEFRANSLIPVALAAATAGSLRIVLNGASPTFSMVNVLPPSLMTMGWYSLLGIILGVIAFIITKTVYILEDAFERLPCHWMWCPALGALAVGVLGYFFPEILGAGYLHIQDLLSGRLEWKIAAVLSGAKLIAWLVATGSGTSGGTLAPLFFVGGGIGYAFGVFGEAFFPHAGIDPRICSLVGMAALFGGASQAYLTSIVLALEVTQQPYSALPLLGGCTASFLISCYLMKNNLMTEELARKGAQVPSDYTSDFFEGVTVKKFYTKEVKVLSSELSVEEVQREFQSKRGYFSHQGYPVLDSSQNLIGIVTKKDLFENLTTPQVLLKELLTKALVTVSERSSLREALDLMATYQIGRLPVVSSSDSKKLVGIVTRSDLLRANQHRIDKSI